MTEPERRGANWQERFDELVELDGAERRRRLAEIEAQDPGLAATLRALLAADEGTSGILSTPLEERAPGLLGELLGGAAGDAAPRPGDRVGSYRLLSLLGRGGMGEVWLAERADGEIEARAAVKLIRPDLVSERAHQRFLRERRILSRLDHPGIARLLDAGRTKAGAPYFVLEHVEGVPITRWCREREASLERALALLAEVSDAVDYAHRALVVHRDLKPSNVLVDGEGRPKLLDFGIARHVLPGPEGDDEEVGDVETSVAASALTPAYAAPEVIRGGPLTVAADVYSLGVLLYELLTGSRPHPRVGALRALADEIDAEEVEPPSRRRRATSEAPPVAARADRLEGDVDAIALKALDADPARRYPSAAALADDLRRYLTGYPVQARKGGLAYVAWRFVARRRLAVGTAAAAVTALLVALVYANAQAAEARNQARRAERAQSFLIDVFAKADPDHDMGDRLTARQLIERSLPRLDAELAEEPELKAELRDVVARALLGIGVTEPALAQAEEAHRELAALFGPDDRRTLLAELTAVETLTEVGRLEGLADRARRVAAALEASGKASEPELYRANNTLARMLAETGDFEGAAAAIRTQLGTLDRRGRARTLDAAILHQGLGSMMVALSRPQEAVVEMRQALGIVDGLGMRETSTAAAILVNLAELVGDLGRPAESIALFEEGIATARKVYAPEAATLGRMLLPYGYELSRQGRRTEAKPVLEEAARIFIALDSYNAAAALRYLGQDAIVLERFEEALALFLQGEEISRRFVGADHYMTLALVQTHGAAETKLGRLKEGEAHLRTALAGLERFFGPEGDFLRAGLRQLGENLRAQGRLDEALEVHRRCRAIERKIFGDKPGAATYSTRRELALDSLALADLPSLADARAEIDASIAEAGSDPMQRGYSHQVSAQIAVAAGDLARARADAEQALAFFRTGGLADDAPSAVAVRALLARLPKPPA